MKDKSKRKVWWNWLHLIVIVFGLLLWLYFAGSGCKSTCGIGVNCPQSTFLECLSQLIVISSFWLYTFIGIIILYLVITLISWLYYGNKK